MVTIVEGTRSDKDAAYAELSSGMHERVLNKYRWFLVHKSPIGQGHVDWEESESLVNQWAVEAACAYDSERSKFITFLTRHLYMRAWNHVRHVFHENRIFVNEANFSADCTQSLDSLTYVIDDSTGMEWEDFYSILTPETRSLLQQILANVEEIARLGNRRPPNLPLIAQYLEVSLEQLTSAMQEIQAKRNECL